MEDFAIRLARAADAAELARLLTVLGHPASASDLARRWQAWSAAGNSAVVAARADGTLAGVAVLCASWMLHRPYPVGRITALVVEEALRGQGLGRTLVAAAEANLAAAGCGQMEITSNVVRIDAHAFYVRLGYAQTSVRLVKTLPAPLPDYGVKA